MSLFLPQHGTGGRISKGRDMQASWGGCTEETISTPKRPRDERKKKQKRKREILEGGLFSKAGVSLDHETNLGWLVLRSDQTSGEKAGGKSHGKKGREGMEKKGKGSRVRICGPRSEGRKNYCSQEQIPWKRRKGRE